jgi:peptidoglycan/LPS O-acetylase OafA/YrhL
LITLLSVTGLIALFVPLSVNSSAFVNVLGFSLLYLSFGGLLLLSIYSESVQQLSSTWPGRLLAYMGARSYLICLWHMAVKDWSPPAA